ncbi:MAG: diaminopimelate epimerase [Phycisphaerales bacterium]|nr:diaminopimelate epimerase [Phycisphaerales bacterium]
MKFVKMHGIGNDYVYIDAVTDPALEARFDTARGAELVRRLSDRHRGIGSDGAILVCRPSDDPERGAGAHVRMRMFNADGSESEMCGNGVRCVAKFAHDRLGAPPTMNVQTGRGVLRITCDLKAGKVEHATVEMGRPMLDLRAGDVDAGKFMRGAPNDGTWQLEALGEVWRVTFVSMGNPHAVFFERGGKAMRADDLAAIDLARLGPVIERHPAFVRRTNAHWAAVHSRGEVTMRTWERGAGATLACGTGACAVVVAGITQGLLDRAARVHLPGGDLSVEWSSSEVPVLMTGPAEDVFEGEWPES